MITMFDPENPQRACSPAEMKAEQAERDFLLARNIMMREMSDYVRAYRTCRLGACRRARRCAHVSRDCFHTMPRIPLSNFEQSCAIEEVRLELVKRRRESRGRK
jgi:hypothetical protein